jgi:hypothetical protein
MRDFFGKLVGKQHPPHFLDRKGLDGHDQYQKYVNNPFYHGVQK